MIFFSILLVSLVINFGTSFMNRKSTKNNLIESLANYRDNLYRKKLKISKHAKQHSLKQFALPGVCATILDNITTIELLDPNSLTPATNNISNRVWRYIWRVVRRTPNQEKFTVRLDHDGSYNFVLNQYNSSDLLTVLEADNFNVGDIEFEESSITSPNDACLLKIYDTTLDAVLIDIFAPYDFNSTSTWFFCVEPRINLKIGQSSAVPGPNDVGDLKIEIKFFNLCANPETELPVDVLSELKTEYKKI